MNHCSHTRPAPWVPTLLGLVPAQRWRELDASHCPPRKMRTPQVGATPDALLSSPRATVTPCPFHTEHLGAPPLCSAISPVCLFPKYVHMYSMYICYMHLLMHPLEGEGVGWRKGGLLIVPIKAE